MTAVEWFLTELEKRQYFIGNDMLEAYNKAKEMEKQQIIDAFNEDLYGGLSSKMKFETGEQYYNETYKPSA